MSVETINEDREREVWLFRRLYKIEKSVHYLQCFISKHLSTHTHTHPHAQTHTHTHKIRERMRECTMPAIINHNPSPCIVVEVFCECKDNNGKLTDELRNNYFRVRQFKNRWFFHSRIGSVLVATELTVAVGWIDNLPGVAMDPGWNIKQ